MDPRNALHPSKRVEQFKQTLYPLDCGSGVARAPHPPRPRGDRGVEGLKEPARGSPGRSSRRKPLSRGPNKLFAGGGGTKIIAMPLDCGRGH